MFVMIRQTRLELVEGDIADQDTDAIVTAAHWDLLGGQGTDGSVHFKAGPRLLDACRAIGGCPIGGAVITDGFDLPARYVIHAVGPVYETGDEFEIELLEGAYRSALELAQEHGLRSVAFPAISTGAFVFPMQEAADIALRTLIAFLKREKHSLELVRIVLYPREREDALALFETALLKLLPRTP
jgi:O-acetyl-ADP-ribose deacetylase (regulator of RNase III)